MVNVFLLYKVRIFFTVVKINFDLKEKNGGNKYRKNVLKTYEWL